MDVKLLHPALAHERACDIGGAFSEQRIGEPPRDGFVARLDDVGSEEYIAAKRATRVVGCSLRRGPGALSCARVGTDTRRRLPP